MYVVPSIRLSNNETCDVEVWTRGGTKSPRCYVFRYKGKRIVPYEQRRLGLYVSFNGLFKIVHSNEIISLSVQNHDTFWKRLKENLLSPKGKNLCVDVYESV